MIVADGMSDDGTRAILEQFAKTEPRLKIVDNPNRIVSTGLNAALAVARGKVIIRMDAHTEFARDYVRSCLEVLEATGADNVGGPWVAKGSGQVGRAIAAAFQSPFAMGGARGHDPSYEGTVDTVYLGCWPRRVFDQIGLFDEELVRNQDDEFNLRLTEHGGRIYQSPRIRSWYTPRNSLRALLNQYKQYGYWKVRVIRKHQKPASIRHLVPAAFMCSLVMLGAASFWSSLAGAAWLALTGSVPDCHSDLLDAHGNGLRLEDSSIPPLRVCRLSLRLRLWLCPRCRRLYHPSPHSTRRVHRSHTESRQQHRRKPSPRW